MPKNNKHKRSDNHKTDRWPWKSNLKHFCTRSMRSKVRQKLKLEKSDENIHPNKNYYGSAWDWD